MEINDKSHLHKADEWRTLLYNGENVHCIVQKKHVRVFYRHTFRINKLEKLLRRKRNLVTNLWFNIYMLYVGAWYFYILLRYRDLDVPIFVYETAWEFMKKLEPQELPNNMAKIIFYSRNNESPNPYEPFPVNRQ